MVVGVEVVDEREVVVVNRCRSVIGENAVEDLEDIALWYVNTRYKGIKAKCFEVTGKKGGLHHGTSQEVGCHSRRTRDMTRTERQD